MTGSVVLVVGPGGVGGRKGVVGGAVVVSCAETGAGDGCSSFACGGAGEAFGGGLATDVLALLTMGG